MNYAKTGIFIAILRKDKNMSQYELAEVLSIYREMVSKWERGVTFPQPDHLLLLSQFFNVSINELILGERETPENKKDLNKATFEILKENKRKLKKVTIGFSLTLALFLFIFLFSYFINTYNSIQVYKITGNGEKFYLLNGIVVVSKTKSYITLGKIEFEEELQYDNIELFYLNENGDKTLLYENNDSYDLVTNIYGHDEIFSYKELERIIEKLYLKITFDGKNETIKLTVKKDMTNNNLFFLNYKKNKDISNNYINSNIPKYIEENFTYDKINNNYYIKYENDKKLYNVYYFVESKMLIVNETISENETIQIEFSSNDNILEYYMIKKDGSMNHVFSINIESYECLSGDCDNKSNLVNSFKTDYYHKYFG